MADGSLNCARGGGRPNPPLHPYQDPSGHSIRESTKRDGDNRQDREKTKPDGASKSVLHRTSLKLPMERAAAGRTVWRVESGRLGRGNVGVSSVNWCTTDSAS